MNEGDEDLSLELPLETAGDFAATDAGLGDTEAADATPEHDPANEPPRTRQRPPRGRRPKRERAADAPPAGAEAGSDDTFESAAADERSEEFRRPRQEREEFADEGTPDADPSDERHDDDESGEGSADHDDSGDDSGDAEGSTDVTTAEGAAGTPGGIIAPARPGQNPQQPQHGKHGRDRGRGRDRHNRNRNGKGEPTGPLTLEDRCVRQFSRVALGRGRAYFSAGRVSDPIWEDQKCSVETQGAGGTYKVEFDFSHVGEQKLPVKCACPAYAEGALCKHLWAAILQVEKASPEGKIPQSGTLKLVHESPRQARQGGEARQPGEGQHSGERGDRHGGQREGRHDRQNRQQSGRGQIVPAAPNRGYAGSWVERLNQLQGVSPTKTLSTLAASFVINAAETAQAQKLVIDLWTRARFANGSMGPMRPNRVANANDFSSYGDVKDREVLSLLMRSGNPRTFAPYGRGSGNVATRFTIEPMFESHLIPLLAQNSKLFLSRAPNGSPDNADRPMRFEAGRSWEFELKIEPATAADQYRLDGSLRRGSEGCSITTPFAILKGGFLIFNDRIGRFAEPAHAAWAIQLRTAEFLVPRTEGDALLTRLLMDPSSPRVTWPAEMGWTLTAIEPKPMGVFRPLGNDPSLGRMQLTVSFDYGGRVIALAETEKTIVDLEKKTVYRRDTDFEEKTLLKALEILRDNSGTGTVPNSDLHRAATELCAAGWVIHFENQQLRMAEDFSMNVSSNTDWFDLKLEASFGEHGVDQAELLKALASNSGLVKLKDGSLGMLPADWVERMAPLAQLGTRFGSAGDDGTFRFSRSQGLMLNSLLTDDTKLKADAVFTSFRDKVAKFETVEKKTAPKGFQGKLRDYQAEGLAWLGFLEAFETGGILADDMGLGKTIQVLAFLLDRAKKNKMPSIVVTPKSLAFNWIDEAAKFAPDLRIVRYTGASRGKLLDDLKDVDVVVTTYGTLRTDIAELREIEFDVAIVDEAQAIKNAKSQSAMACKRLRARHKIALTGTPIENSINDLLSILEFTNPGLLPPQGENAQDTHSLLAKTLKPFMLRRTKEKVLTELPDKSEQVLACEMSPMEKQFYVAIRNQYRESLEAKIATDGLAKSRLHVLEALLRLRQAACHPGLVDPKLKSEGSAKLQLLLNHIQEVTAEGHKVLVFSQFTSLLALVKTQLDEAGVVYEYLDGQTQDRKTPVERFQTDPKVPVFLISLKAGGTGLNLTAADYVFILDPWWNPAVEAQAIGRAHRMGQQQKVFAYRMIAKGTVEEKILELQKSKRELAESLISEDENLFKKLTKKDLEVLLT